METETRNSSTEELAALRQENRALRQRIAKLEGLEIERRQTKAELQESKQRYKELVNNLPVGVYRNTPGANGHFLEANPNIVAIFEADSKEEFLRHNVSDLYQNPEDRQTFSTKMQKSGLLKGEELRLKTLKGKSIWGAVTAIMKKDAQGQVYFDGIIEDITERKQVEETLHQQNEYLAALHETTLDLISQLDLNDLLTALINRAGQLLGTRHGYIFLAEPGAETSIECKVGVGIFRQRAGDRLKRGEGLAGRVWQTGQPLVVDNYDTWHGRSPVLPSGLIEAVMGVPLSRTNRDTQAGFEVVGIIGLAYESGSDRTFGDDEVELLSRFAQLASIALDNARLYTEAQDARTTAEITAQELSQTLDHLKTTQDQLIETEKMAALGQLVAGVAHEINTPVGVGVTAASALEDKTIAFLDIYNSGQMKRSDLEKYLNMAEQSSSMILRNLSRATELIQSFKQVAVDQSTEEQRRFAVKPYLEEVLLSLRPKLKKTQHTIEIQGSDDITVESYPGVFSQIVTNLVMNSLIHAYEPDDEGQLTFVLIQEDSHLTFEYADDGKGISKENLSKIFDPFFTTKRGQGGSGLGLHIIYNLVTQKLGGTIRCESEVGSGVRFVIELPFSPKNT